MAEAIWGVVVHITLIVVAIRALRWWLGLLNRYPGLFESEPIVPRQPNKRKGEH